MLELSLSLRWVRLTPRPSSRASRRSRSALTLGLLAALAVLSLFSYLDSSDAAAGLSATCDDNSPGDVIAPAVNTALGCLHIEALGNTARETIFILPDRLPDRVVVRSALLRGPPFSSLIPPTSPRISPDASPPLRNSPLHVGWHEMNHRGGPRAQRTHLPLRVPEHDHMCLDGSV